MGPGGALLATLGLTLAAADALPPPAAGASVAAGPQPLDLADAVQRALELMYRGVREFEDTAAQKGSKQAPASGADAMEVLRATSANLGDLLDVVKQFREQQKHEVERVEGAAGQRLAVVQAENVRLKAREVELEATGKDLEARAQTLVSIAEQCQAQQRLAKKAESTVGKATDLQQVLSLQGLVDQLRGRLKQMEERVDTVQGQNGGLEEQHKTEMSRCGNETAKFHQEVVQLQAERRTLQAKLDKALWGRRMFPEQRAEQRAQLFTEAQEAATRKWYKKNHNLLDEIPDLKRKAAKSKAVEVHLAQQAVAAQREEATLKTIVKNLQQQNADLKEDKGHLMDTLQSMLRQSAMYQQDLLACEQRGPDAAPAVAMAAAKGGAGEDHATDGAADPGAGAEDPIATMGETTSIDKYIVSTVDDATSGGTAGAARAPSPRAVGAAAPRGLRGPRPTMGTTAATAVTALPRLPQAPPEAVLPPGPVAQRRLQAAVAEAAPALGEDVRAEAEILADNDAAEVRLAVEQPPSDIDVGVATPAPKPPLPQAAAAVAMPKPKPPLRAATVVASAARPGAMARAAANKTAAAAASPSGSAAAPLHSSLTAWLGVPPAPTASPHTADPAADEISGDAVSKLMMGAEQELSATDDGDLPPL